MWGGKKGRAIPALLLLGVLGACSAGEPERPSFLLFLTDDHSWIHVGCYGDEGLSTPNMDSLAESGVRFEHAYCASPSCVASRSALLTGQEIWRLAEGGVFGGTLPRTYPVYPLLLEESGYHVGWTGKGWGPGNLVSGGWDGAWPQGRPYQDERIDKEAVGLTVFHFDYAANFRAFLDERDPSAPFAFWCGITEPHPPYTADAWRSRGKSLDQARVPGHLPDSATVRGEVLDYGLEIEYLDGVLGEMLDLLEERGLASNTLVCVTGDNGIALPRCKGTLYDSGTRMPFLIAWPAGLDGGRVESSFVSLTDLAPTFLELAGAEVPAAMTGKSLVDVLEGTGPGRSFVVTGLERHGYARPGALGYPARALRDERWLYIRNFAPERAAAGDPDFQSPISRRRRGFLEIADTPTKFWMLQNRDRPAVRRAFEAAFGNRPAEELYDCEHDPDQLVNLASNPAHAETLARLREELEDYLTRTEDPRMRGEAPWDEYGWDWDHVRPSTFAE